MEFNDPGFVCDIYRDNVKSQESDEDILKKFVGVYSFAGEFAREYVEEKLGCPEWLNPGAVSWDSQTEGSWFQDRFYFFSIEDFDEEDFDEVWVFKKIVKESV